MNIQQISYIFFFIFVTVIIKRDVGLFFMNNFIMMVIIYIYIYICFFNFFFFLESCMLLQCMAHISCLNNFFSFQAYPVLMGDIDPSLNLNAHIIHAFTKKIRTKLQSSVGSMFLNLQYLSSERV